MAQDTHTSTDITGAKENIYINIRFINKRGDYFWKTKDCAVNLSAVVVQKN